MKNKKMVKNFSEIKYRAMSFLARREHSISDLSKKLTKLFPDDSKVIYDVVKELKQLDLQSDLRFSEMLAATRIRKGYGPNKIFFELKNHKVTEDIIERVMMESGVDWFRLARKVLAKKFSSSTHNNFSLEVKKRNFLQYRGFRSEHISACLKQ
jgi:regulatory protein